MRAGLKRSVHFAGDSRLLARSGLFDPAFYRRQLPWRRWRSFILLEHYLLVGGSAGKKPCPLFDGAWYLKQNPDVSAARLNPLVHYLREGWREGRNPHPLFDIRRYFADRPDLLERGIEPLGHYLRSAYYESLNPHPLFLSDWYLEQNPSVRASRVNPLVDYIENGYKERRNPHPLFDNDYYLAVNPERDRIENPLIHYVTTGFRRNASPHRLFDVKYYQKKYPDLTAADLNPLIHYVTAGAAEHRDPHPLFETTYYLSQLAADALASANPLAHYLSIGASLRLSPHPLFDPEHYQKQMERDADPACDLLMHYLEKGCKAGLDPCELFDSSYYRNRYAPYLQEESNPLAHYVTEGVRLGCNPNPIFETKYYLRRYPDVRVSGQNPLEHYLRSGAFESRSPSPFFDTGFYLRTYGNALRPGENPLADYLVRGGAQAGRDPSPFFATRAYLGAHPELQESGHNPLAHYLSVHFENAAPDALPPDVSVHRTFGSPDSRVDLLLDLTAGDTQCARQGVARLLTSSEWRQCFADVTILLPPGARPPDPLHDETALDVTAPIQACNMSRVLAANTGHHLLILREYSEISVDLLRGLLEAFDLDPHFGVSIPRFLNRVTGGIRKISPQQGDLQINEYPESIIEYSPRYYILPEILSPCCLVRDTVVANISGLDRSFDSLSGALFHYVVRVRRAGFRTVVMNHALLDTAKGSDSSLEITPRDLRKILVAYPDASKAKLAVNEHPAHAREGFLGRVLSSDPAVSRTLLLDLRGIPDYMNGTAEAALAICDALADLTSEWQISYLASPAAAAFHQLQSRYPRWSNSRDPRNRFSVAFRLSQPWDVQSQRELHTLAFLNCYFMLDTIAWDILYEAPQSLGASWEFLFQHADGILYDSFYTRDRAARRFPTAQSCPGEVSHCSFHPRDYQVPSVEKMPNDYLFVIGNMYDHKDLVPTVDVLASTFPDLTIKALGLRDNSFSNVQAISSGRVSTREIESLFANASLIVFPSLYEGFGFPVIKGLSYGKTVIARHSELLLEVAARYRGPGTLLSFHSPADLTGIVRRVIDGTDMDGMPLGQALPAFAEPKSWREVAGSMLTFLEERLRQANGSRWDERERAFRYLVD